MTKPRVLCVMQLPPPVHGVTVMNQCVADSDVLATRFSIDVVPLRFADSLDQLRRVSARKIFRAIRTGVQLARALSARPDVVYFTLTPTGIAFYRDCAYAAMMRLSGVPRVYHLHSAGVADRASSRWTRALCTWVFEGARVIQLSGALRADTRAVVPDERIMFVANGIPDGGAPMDRVDHEVPRVLFLSNMLEAKGPLVLLDALAALAARNIRFEATFAGARLDDGCVEKFERAVTTLGLEQMVRYVGPVYGADKEALLRSHDVFVLPTYDDAFPVVLLEAMQAGLPVVATAVGAIPEIVEDQATGFVIPPGSVDALVDRFAVLLRDPGRSRTMGVRGHARFVERYTIDRFERELARSLEDCVEASRGRS